MQNEHAKHYFVIHTHWDDETRRWTATSEDIPGLVTEADSFEELIARVKDIAPELLALNSTDVPERFPLQFEASYLTEVRQ